ncbi:MAG: class I SAM-dependent methyltransferase [Planctomycetaceae bacterium]|nr:class I SAM-dependent methyltransferase [Planctomycetaceae bacterium]
MSVTTTKPESSVIDEFLATSEQEFFDSLVRDQGSFNPFSDAGWQTIERRFVEFIAPQSGDRLLDIGCGTGESRKLYIDHVDTYTGIDLSAASIEFARQRFPNSNWQTANACELPFADGSFDVVAFSSVLHHIDDYLPALEEARRVLTPGGRVFAFDPNVLHPAMALFRKPESPFYLSAGVSPNERPLLPRDLYDRFQAAGLEDIRQRAQSSIPYRHVAPRLINSALSLYNFADRLWEACGLGRWLGTFVITAASRPQHSSERA